MALTLSDINKRVRYKDSMRFGHYEGLLIGVSTNHQTAFVEWDDPLRRRKREAVPSHLLKIVERDRVDGTGIEGGTLEGL